MGITIYEGVTLLILGIGILFVIIGLTAFKTKGVIRDDERSMDDEQFRKEISLIDEKIVEMNDYHEFVQKQMEDKHKELLFLYQMMTEKEKAFKDQVRLFDERYMSLKQPDAQKVMEHTMPVQDMDLNKKKQIIELARKGMSDLDIAKTLNIGQGEVSLILNLYH